MKQDLKSRFSFSGCIRDFRNGSNYPLHGDYYRETTELP